MTREATHTLDDEPFIPDGEPATDPDDGALVLEGMVMRMALDELGRDEWAPILIVSKDQGKSWQTEQGETVVLKAVAAGADEISAADDPRAAILTAVTIAVCERWDGETPPRAMIVALADRWALSAGEIDEICERLKIIANAVALADVQAAHADKEPS